MINKKILLTGDRPTGSLHLGHYVGALKNRVLLQREYESFVMIADVQALTDNFNNPEKVRKSVFEVALDNLSVGVDPKITSMFIQSQIPEIAELTVFYSNLVTVSELQRNPTVKNEIQEKGHIFKKGIVTLGFLAYPVSQAADITFCKAEVVPVGKDQKPMIEQTRRIVEKFNKIYGDTFPLPNGVFSDVPKLLGLDGKKMSKSLNNAIYLSDSRDEIKKKIIPAKTDSECSVRYDTVNKFGVSNLMTYYMIATGLNYEEIEQKFNDITSYKTFKEDLVNQLDNLLSPIRKRREELAKNPAYVWGVLEEGRVKARDVARKTIQDVKSKMRIDY